MSQKTCTHAHYGPPTAMGVVRGENRKAEKAVCTGRFSCAVKGGRILQAGSRGSCEAGSRAWRQRSQREATPYGRFGQERREMKKATALFLGIAIVCAGFAGCASGGGEVDGIVPVDTLAAAPAPEQAEPGAAGAAIALTDMAGREVRLDGPATRIVALTASDVEALYAVGAGGTLVGRGEYCNYPPEALDVQSVQSGYETNIEQIIALEPQLLLMGTMAQTEEQLKQLEDAGIVAFVTDAQDIEGAYTAIGLVGRLTGKEAEAEGVIETMKATFADLQGKAATAGGEQKSIYFEVSPLEYGLWAAGSSTFMNEVAEMLGLRNIFGDIPGWAEVSEEQVLERDPDYILTVGMYLGDGPTPIESILSRPGWENITAVKNGAILNLTEDELSRPGPRLADGARMLYDFVYGG